MDCCLASWLCYIIPLVLLSHVLYFFFADADFTLLWTCALGHKPGMGRIVVERGTITDIQYLQMIKQSRFYSVGNVSLWRIFITAELK